MSEFLEELDRRISQFAAHLKTMHRRSHDEVHGPCFLIFQERPSTSEFSEASLTRAAIPDLELVEAAFDDAGMSAAGINDGSLAIELPDEGWREDDAQNRFVQFSFEENWFC